MTDAAREKGERVATRIGVWKPGQICRNGGAIVNWKDDDERAKCPICQNIVFSRQGYHDIPCPDPSDPAMIVAMLEWLIGSGYISFAKVKHGEIYWEHRCAVSSAKTLSAALIDAIDALPQEVRNESTRHE